MIKITNNLKSNNPLVRILLAIGGLITVGLTLFLGAIALVFVVGFLVFVSIIFSIIYWFFKKNLEKMKGSYQKKTSNSSMDSKTLEGEYHEVDE